MATKHTHKWQLYQRRVGRRLDPVMIKGERSFICAWPDCGTFKALSQVLNKFSICNECGKPFIFDQYASTRSVPKCLICRHTKDARELQIANDIVEEFLLGESVINEIKADMKEEERIPDWLKLENEVMSQITFDEESIKRLSIEPEDVK